MRGFNRQVNLRRYLYFIFIFIGSTFAIEQLNLSKLYQYMEAQYGHNAKRRTEAWRNIILQETQSSEIEKLEKVNRYFNLFDFVDDIQLWGKEDYWATPLEFIGLKAGDCEDFSIAKYFSLIELGLPVDKLRLTYVKSKTLNQFHMVLAYYASPQAMPLILDNIDGAIKPANQRRDLIPIFSFNGQKLWLNKQKGKGQVISGPERLKNWNDLSKRYLLSNFKQ